MTNSPSVFKTTMSSREIAALVGSPHDSVLKTIRRLVVEGLVSANETRYTHPQNGQQYPEFSLGFRDTMLVASGYSSDLRAKIIDRWQALEAVVAQPANVLSGDAATAELRFLEAVVKSLNIAPSGHLGGVRNIAIKYDQTATLAILPQYAIDAPTSSTTGSSEPTASASTLLKKHDIKMSTVKFNTKLVEIGMLADMTRPSTSSPTGFKTFKAVVGKGLDYGKNVTNPGNPRETQPHWYSHKFLDLIDLLK